MTLLFHQGLVSILGGLLYGSPAAVWLRIPEAGYHLNHSESNLDFLSVLQKQVMRSQNLCTVFLIEECFLLKAWRRWGTNGRKSLLEENCFHLVSRFRLRSCNEKWEQQWHAWDVSRNGIPVLALLCRTCMFKENKDEKVSALAAKYSQCHRPFGNHKFEIHYGL